MKGKESCIGKRLKARREELEEKETMNYIRRKSTWGTRTGFSFLTTCISLTGSQPLWMPGIQQCMALSWWNTTCIATIQLLCMQTVTEFFTHRYSFTPAYQPVVWVNDISEPVHNHTIPLTQGSSVNTTSIAHASFDVSLIEMSRAKPAPLGSQ